MKTYFGWEVSFSEMTKELLRFWWKVFLYGALFLVCNVGAVSILLVKHIQRAHGTGYQKLVLLPLKEPIRFFDWTPFLHSYRYKFNILEIYSFKFQALSFKLKGLRTKRLLSVISLEECEASCFLAGVFKPSLQSVTIFCWAFYLFSSFWMC